jgi:hypothetical protein
MLGLQTLDVIIGLIVVYLLLGLVCTAVNEWLSSMFSFKAKTLWQAVQTMIAKGEKFNPFSAFRFLNVNAQTHKDASKVANFYAHPLIDTLSRKNQLPSYISAQTFRTVLLDINKVHIPNKDDFEMVKASVAAVGDPKLNAILSTFVNAAEGVEDKVGHFNAQIETWFEECMDRASGWYKRQIQFITVCFAAGMVILFNVDSVKLTRALWTSAPLRESFVALSKDMVKYDNVDDLAKDFKVKREGGKAVVQRVVPDFEKQIVVTDSQNNTDTINVSNSAEAEAITEMEATESFGTAKQAAAAKEYQTLKTQLSIPIGWETEKWTEIWAYGTQDKLMYILAKFIGLFMSVAAASMGAPFWFNMLKTVSSIKNKS